MRNIGIGIVGTGFMGRAHALAYRAVAGVFPDVMRPVFETVCDIEPRAAEQAAAQFQFARWETRWQALVADPKVEIVSIATPDSTHREIALAAIAAGKHVHCEKPLAPTLETAGEMMQAAEASGVITQVGFNYIKNPLLRLAREMIAAGEIGEVTGFRGVHAEDYMSDPDSPFTWRLEPGGGALADLGSHIIGMARFLLGPIAEVHADLETVVKTRPVAPGADRRRAVVVDDIARLVVRFARGCRGAIEANWVATGRKMQLGFEAHGTKGSLVFTQERFNELLFFRAGGHPRHGGFARIEAGPQHSPYGRFCVAPGHQLGFNDLKTIEVADFLAAIAGGEKRGPDFREAWEVQRVVDAALRSSQTRSWQSLG